MKVLFVGNSHFSALKLALDADQTLLDGIEPYFYIFPSGWGPSFTIDNEKRLCEIASAVNPKFPPRTAPESVRELPLDYYDAIVIGALGFIDGGFFYQHPLTKQGQLHAFGPKPNELSTRLVSKTAMTRMVQVLLSGQHGFQLLSNLRQHVSVPILVMPFPRLSTSVRDHPKWSMNLMYEDPIGAHRFFAQVCDEFLAQASADAKAELLPHPKIAASDDPLFTPQTMMNPHDGLHGLASYGELVLRQITTALCRSRSSV